MRNLLFAVIFFLMIAIVSCGPSNQPKMLESENIVTPSQTPFSVLKGALFFDYDGNGMHEENEPAIVNFGVCVKAQELEPNNCVITDEKGNFHFEKFVPNDSEIQLIFIDPNKDIPSLAFRYTNIFNKEIIIPSYEFNNIIVPEQHLNDTSIDKIENGAAVKSGDNIIIGLMQGIVTMPLDTNGLTVLNKVMGFDQNPSKGVRDYTGNTYECYTPESCQTKSINLKSSFIGTGDSHRGIDFGDFNNPKGIPFFAAHAGYVTTFEGSHIVNGKRAVCVNVSTDKNWSFGYSKGITTSYQHADNLAVRDGDFVYRGQFLGFVGSTGTQWTHLHFEAWYGNAFKRSDEGYLYNKDFYAMENPDYVITGFNDLSLWTVWNSPQHNNINLTSISFASKPKSTPQPISNVPITIDGKDDDWLNISPILVDIKGDSLDGNSADLKDAYMVQDKNYLFLIIRATGSFIKSKEAQIDVMFDIKTGSHCDDSEIGINIQQKNLPAFWDSQICDNAENVKQISNALFKWDNVVEIRVPLQIFGDFEYIKPISVILNLHDTKWYTSDSMQ